MEVCVDSLESAIEAELGGANRIELCSALKCGGLSPSLGLLKMVKKIVKVPVFVMLRHRDGDFCYNEFDIEVLKKDLLDFKNIGADGFVFGSLTLEGEIDENVCGQIVDLAKPYPVTFHRAIDLCPDILKSLEIVIALGFKKILTSGGQTTALEGTPMINKMIEKGDSRITIIPGAGITPNNLRRILSETKAREFHASASVSKVIQKLTNESGVRMGSGDDGKSRKISSREKVSQMIRIFKEVNDS